MSSLACCDPYYTEYTCKDKFIKCCPDTCYNCCQKYYSHIVMGKTVYHEKKKNIARFENIHAAFGIDFYSFDARQRGEVTILRETAVGTLYLNSTK